MGKYIRMLVFIGLAAACIFLGIRGLQSDNKTGESDRQLLDDIGEGESEFQDLNTELEQANSELAELEREFSEYRISAEARNSRSQERIIQLESEIVRIEQIVNDFEVERDELQRITGETSEATRRIRETLEEIKTQSLD